MIYPPPLPEGGCIGLVAPASPVTEEERDACVRALEERGYRVRLSEGLKSEGLISNGRGSEGQWLEEAKSERTHWRPWYLAGEARQRAWDLNGMFRDSRIHAIFCIRGGYGSAQLLPHLDYRMIRRSPKIFVGYSDITSLHMALQKNCGLVTFHGPMGRPDLIAEDSFFAWEGLRRMIGWDGEMARAGRSIFQNPAGEQIEEIRCKTSLEAGEQIKEIRCKMPPESLISGDKMGNLSWGWDEKESREGLPRRIHGRLTGGNLSVLLHLAGTGCLPDMSGKILFLEDVHESVPRIHMGLIQLAQMGILHQVRGVLLGGFTECGEGVEGLLEDFFGRRGIPCLKNICSDHRLGMGTLPLGAMCEMRMAEREVAFFKNNLPICENVQTGEKKTL